MKYGGRKRKKNRENYGGDKKEKKNIRLEMIKKGSGGQVV